jgi:hypothetical protein
MMSVAEARNLLASTGTARHDEAIGHAPIFEWYRESTDSAARARVVEAAEVVLTEGHDDEHDFVVVVLGLDANPERMSRLVNLYEARGWDASHPLADFFRWRELAPEARATLARLYRSDPARQVTLLQPVLPLDQDGGAWRAFLATVRKENRPRHLVRAHRACPLDRHPAFFEAMRGKAEQVVRRTARDIASESALELLAVCGYLFDPRPAPRDPPGSVPVEEMLSFLESQRCSIWRMLPALVQYPEDQDRSVFYRRPPVPFPRSLFLPSRGEGRFWDAWYRHDPPEVVSVEARTGEAFHEHFRSQWGQAKLVPLVYVEPYARVPRFVLRHVEARMSAR